MPAIGWKCPLHGPSPWSHRCEKWQLWIAEAEEDAEVRLTRTGFRLSPSTVLNCIREHHLKIETDYFIDYKAQGPMWLGGTAHERLTALGRKHAPLVKIVERKIHGFKTAFSEPEVVPIYALRIGLDDSEKPATLFAGKFDLAPEGIPFVGEIDAAVVNLRTGAILEIEDWKSGAPFGDPTDPARSSGPVQLNLYRLMVAEPRPSSLILNYVAKDADRMKCAVMTEDEILEHRPGDGAQTVRDHIQAHLMFALKEKNDFSVLPLSGKTMYVSVRKGTSSCDRCVAKGACDGLVATEGL